MSDKWHRKPRAGPSPPPQHRYRFEHIVPLQDGAIPLTDARAQPRAGLHRRRHSCALRRVGRQCAGAAGGACALQRGERKQRAGRGSETPSQGKGPANESGRAKPPAPWQRLMLPQDWLQRRKERSGAKIEWGGGVRVFLFPQGLSSSRAGQDPWQIIFNLN